MDVSPALAISIHAPRTGSDFHVYCDTLFHVISIHAPRTGSDANGAHVGVPSSRFQSTLPARGATLVPCLFERHFLFQSTLPARGATLDSYALI